MFFYTSVLICDFKVHMLLSNIYMSLLVLLSEVNFSWYKMVRVLLIV